VDLVEIDMAGAETAQAVVQLGDQPAARTALMVPLVAHGMLAFVASTMSSRRPSAA
jgi:hypothetical protein